MPKGILKDHQFIGGLKTEFTGLNFPENACTETFDCVFHRTGKVTRRLGINHEQHRSLLSVVKQSRAISSYHWKNASGDGSTSILAQQVGTTIYFYNTAAVTLSTSVSGHRIDSTINLNNFRAQDATSVDRALECTYADGNRYLFIFHPNTDPIYCEFDNGFITGRSITIRVRDSGGIDEPGVADTDRAATLTDIHRYNLKNQGWSGTSWSSTASDSIPYDVGQADFNIDEDLPIDSGDYVRCITTDTTDPMNPVTLTMFGSVTTYAPTSGALRVEVTSLEPNNATYIGDTYSSWIIQPVGDYITEWFEAVGNYPSNADVWWYFKNEDEDFDPAGKINSVSQSAGPAPKGSYILNAFHQDRSEASGIDGLTVVTSNGIRPSLGAWFQGRIWYSGVNYRDFNERLYYSQIIENPNQFGKCHTVNDPTSQDRFDLLPSDGGYIKIQGIGAIHKLFPTNNGMLVFGSKGIWFITGSTGIGFTANDYTVTNISAVESLSHSSFVNILGNPAWWNKEGIYMVQTTQGGTNVQSMTNTTIATFYQSIPLSSKYTVKGQYNPITFQVQWLYRDKPAASTTQKYEFNRILNFDTQIGAFYPWKVDHSPAIKICDITLVGGGGTQESITPVFKYLTSDGSYITYSDCSDTTFKDWASAATADYESYFITGYKVPTEGMKELYLPYVNVYAEGEESQVILQALWNYTTSGDQGKWSSTQHLTFLKPDRAFQTRKVRLRGSGKAVQLKFSSIPGQPMSLIGWSMLGDTTQLP